MRANRKQRIDAYIKRLAQNLQQQDTNAAIGQEQKQQNHHHRGDTLDGKLDVHEHLRRHSSSSNSVRSLEAMLKPVPKATATAT